MRLLQFSRVTVAVFTLLIAGQRSVTRHVLQSLALAAMKNWYKHDPSLERIGRRRAASGFQSREFSAHVGQRPSRSALSKPCQGSFPDRRDDQRRRLYAVPGLLAA